MPSLPHPSWIRPPWNDTITISRKNGFVKPKLTDYERLTTCCDLLLIVARWWISRAYWCKWSIIFFSIFLGSPSIFLRNRLFCRFIEGTFKSYLRTIQQYEGRSKDINKAAGTTFRSLTCSGPLVTEFPTLSNDVIAWEMCSGFETRRM